MKRSMRIAKVMIISADVIDKMRFIIYVDDLRARELLTRIFVNKCHIIITDVEYRKKLERLSRLYRYDVSMVLMTATLSIRMKGWFRRLMLMIDGNMIRARTRKRNVRYRVI